MYKHMRVYSKCVGLGNCWTTKGPIRGPTQCKDTNGYYSRISQVTQETNLQTHIKIYNSLCYWLF